MAQKISVKTLLEAGVHFGHQTRRWNPKMKPYIFTERNDIYILDLKQTLFALDEAYSFVLETAQRGGKILFVGTKKQAQESIERNASRAGMPYVTQRWLGGMLTNFVTMRSRVARMEQLEAQAEAGITATLPKKEQAKLGKELAKLQANLGGVRDMTGAPQALFVVDTVREEIAIREARRLHIPVIGMLDTNSDPDVVDFGIPANDDAIRSIDLITTLMADAVVAGTGVDEGASESPAAAEADAKAFEEAQAAEPETAAPEA